MGSRSTMTSLRSDRGLRQAFLPNGGPIGEVPTFELSNGLMRCERGTFTLLVCFLPRWGETLTGGSKMRTRSVLTTAASVLLASTVFAAAQGTQKQGPGGEGAPAPAQTQQHEGQQGKQAPQKGERRENGSQKGAQAQEREGSGKQQQGKQETQKEQRGEPKGKGERNDAAQRNERNERNDAAQRNERNDAQRGE